MAILDISEPLIGALNDNNPEVVKNLINDVGMDLNDKDEYGETQLHYAIVNYNSEHVVDMLLKAGADVNACNWDGNTPLHTAASNHMLNMVKILLGAGADVTLKNKLGKTALQLAVGEFGFDIQQVLIDAGADVNTRDIYGVTLLHEAVMENNYDAIHNYLLVYGIEVNLKDKIGRSPLHWACLYNEEDSYLDVGELLFNCGVDPLAVDDEGKMPIDLIVTENQVNTDFYELILKFMKKAEEKNCQVEVLQKIPVTLKRRRNPEKEEDDLESKKQKLEVKVEKKEPDTVFDLLQDIQAEIVENQVQVNESIVKKWESLAHKIQGVCKENEDLKKKICSSEAKEQKCIVS